MSMLNTRRKKIFAFLVAIVAGSFVAIPQLLAQTTTTTDTTLTGAAQPGPGLAVLQQIAANTAPSNSGMSILQQIATTTANILTALTNISNPVVLTIVTALTNLTASDNATDPASPTPNLQTNFSGYVTGVSTSNTAQINLQHTLESDFFGNALTTTTAPYLNDLAFSSWLTLLGGNNQLYFNPDPRGTTVNGVTISPPYNYLKNAAGLTISHVLPAGTWKGHSVDQARYANYYNTVSAVQTFNGYILSEAYNDMLAQLNSLQTTLINQASDAKAWFATVTTENIGAVLRQTLMYESQTYILTVQLLQEEKKILAAQALTNSLAIASGSAGGEGLLLSRAITASPGS